MTQQLQRGLLLGPGSPRGGIPHPDFAGVRRTAVLHVRCELAQPAGTAGFCVALQFVGFGLWPWRSASPRRLLLQRPGRDRSPAFAAACEATPQPPWCACPPPAAPRARRLSGAPPPGAALAAAHHEEGHGGDEDTYAWPRQLRQDDCPQVAGRGAPSRPAADRLRGQSLTRVLPPALRRTSRTSHQPRASTSNRSRRQGSS